MSSRPVFMLWVSVNVKGKSRVRFFIPVPLFVALALADMLDDWGTLASLFCPRASIATKENGRQPFSKWARTATGTLFDLMWEIVFLTGPLDLVDVDVQGEHETVKIKVLTR